MITIDGSAGEGGGQILRSSLALALVTGMPFTMHSIRARRARPGLMRQHLAAIRAAADVGRAEVSGAEMGSHEIAFRPQGPPEPGVYAWSVGSAGSATLVLQTVLPALAIASGPSELTLTGGTHNPMAPPFEFLDRTFLPLLARMGPRVSARLLTPGFYPAGGGRLQATITPAPLAPMDLLWRGAIQSRRVVAAVANLPVGIARREIDAARKHLGWEGTRFDVEVLQGATGPGNVLLIVVEAEQVTEVFTGFGEKGVRAELVAARAATEARAWVDADVPVGRHLADQLLLPMALAGGGAFRTVVPSLHTRTQIDLLGRLLGARVALTDEGSGAFRIDVRAGQ
jgi:RNA 3'-terminal phosphate cyclase (ATP)